MKTSTAILMFVASATSAITCPSNCTEWKGNCACEAKQEAIPSVKPSDELPRKEQQLCWQTGECSVVNVPNLAAEDLAMDKAKADADSEGKRAAGIK